MIVYSTLVVIGAVFSGISLILIAYNMEQLENRISVLEDKLLKGHS